MDRLTLDINKMNEQSLSALASEELIKMVLVLKDENEIPYRLKKNRLKVWSVEILVG